MNAALDYERWFGKDQLEEILDPLRKGYVEEFGRLRRKIPSGPFIAISQRMAEAAREGVEVCLGVRSVDTGTHYMEGSMGQALDIPAAQKIIKMFPDINPELPVRHSFVQSAMGGRGDYSRQIEQAFPEIVTPAFVERARENARFATFYPA